jgi:hypothetical protein
MRLLQEDVVYNTCLVHADYLALLTSGLAKLMPGKPAKSKDRLDQLTAACNHLYPLRESRTCWRTAPVKAEKGSSAASPMEASVRAHKLVAVNILRALRSTYYHSRHANAETQMTNATKNRLLTVLDNLEILHSQFEALAVHCVAGSPGVLPPEESIYRLLASMARAYFEEYAEAMGETAVVPPNRRTVEFYLKTPAFCSYLCSRVVRTPEGRWKGLPLRIISWGKADVTVARLDVHEHETLRLPGSFALEFGETIEEVMSSSSSRQDRDYGRSPTEHRKPMPTTSSHGSDHADGQSSSHPSLKILQRESQFATSYATPAPEDCDGDLPDEMDAEDGGFGHSQEYEEHSASSFELVSPSGEQPSGHDYASSSHPISPPSAQSHRLPDDSFQTSKQYAAIPDNSEPMASLHAPSANPSQSGSGPAPSRPPSHSAAASPSSLVGIPQTEGSDDPPNDQSMAFYKANGYGGFIKTRVLRFLEGDYQNRDFKIKRFNGNNNLCEALKSPHERRYIKSEYLVHYGAPLPGF